MGGECPQPPPGQLLAGISGGECSELAPLSRVPFAAPGTHSGWRRAFLCTRRPVCGGSGVLQLTPAGLCSLTDLEAVSRRSRCGLDGP